jgi:hypothetical protein
MKIPFNTGDIVRPKTKEDAFSILCSFPTSNEITTETEFEVALVVEKSRTYNNVEESGIIIAPAVERDTFLWPFVWNPSKFVKVNH